MKYSWHVHTCINKYRLFLLKFRLGNLNNTKITNLPFSYSICWHRQSSRWNIKFNRYNWYFIYHLIFHPLIIPNFQCLCLHWVLYIPPASVLCSVSCCLGKWTVLRKPGTRSGSSWFRSVLPQCRSLPTRHPSGTPKASAHRSRSTVKDKHSNIFKMNFAIWYIC